MNTLEKLYKSVFIEFKKKEIMKEEREIGESTWIERERHREREGGRKETRKEGEGKKEGRKDGRKEKEGRKDGKKRKEGRMEGNKYRQTVERKKESQSVYKQSSPRYINMQKLKKSWPPNVSKQETL